MICLSSFAISSLRYWLRSFWSSIAALICRFTSERDRAGGDQRAERADAEFLALALALGFAPRD